MAAPEDYFDHIEIIAEFHDVMPSSGPCNTTKDGEGIVGITHWIVFTDSGNNPPGGDKSSDQKS